MTRRADTVQLCNVESLVFFSHSFCLYISQVTVTSMQINQQTEAGCELKLNFSLLGECLTLILMFSVEIEWHPCLGKDYFFILWSPLGWVLGPTRTPCFYSFAFPSPLETCFTLSGSLPDSLTPFSPPSSLLSHPKAQRLLSSFHVKCQFTGQPTPPQLYFSNRYVRHM